MTKKEIENAILVCEKVLKIFDGDPENPIRIAAEQELERLTSIEDQRPIAVFKRDLVLEVALEVQVKGNTNPDDYRFMTAKLEDHLNDLLIDLVYDSVGEANDYGDEPLSIMLDVKKR